MDIEVCGQDSYAGRCGGVLTMTMLWVPPDGDDALQAMTINSRLHALHLHRKDGTVTEIASFLRSGAFATHGRKPRRLGLAGLINMASACNQVGHSD